jgi:hypothetical protein
VLYQTLGWDRLYDDISVSELTRCIFGLERTDPLDGRDREQVHHVVLPKLVELGLVTFEHNGKRGQGARLRIGVPEDLTRPARQIPSAEYDGQRASDLAGPGGRFDVPNPAHTEDTGSTRAERYCEICGLDDHTTEGCGSDAVIFGPFSVKDAVQGLAHGFDANRGKPS